MNVKYVLYEYKIVQLVYNIKNQYVKSVSYTDCWFDQRRVSLHEVTVSVVQFKHIYFISYVTNNSEDMQFIVDTHYILFFSLQENDTKIEGPQI